MANHSNHFTESDIKEPKEELIKPNKYQKGKIYAIRSHQTDKIYIGSTCNSLSKRLYEHRDHFKHGRNNLTSFKILEYPDHYIELVESFPCNNKMELEKREGETIRLFINSVNKNIAGKKSKEQILDRIKEWTNKNIGHVKNYKADYFKNNNKKLICKDCGGKYDITSFSRHSKTIKHYNFFNPDNPKPKRTNKPKVPKPDIIV